MFLRARRDGMRVLSQLPPSPHVPAVSRPQLRVLRTQSRCKGAQYPASCTASAPLLHWCETAHRIPHISPSAMAAHTQTRSHAGHAHHHHHDTSFLLSKNKNDAGVRITRIGLYVNLGMAVGKGFGGYVFNSQGEALCTGPATTGTDTHQHSSPTPSTV